MAVLTLSGTSCYNATTGDTEIKGIARFKLPVIPQTGSHKVMVFSEMHYQPSHRLQEAPRIMPPSDSVPFVAMGGPELVTEVQVDSELAVPDRVARSYDPAHAAELFRVNCAMCHGLAMQGDGAMAKMMKEKEMGPVPADLTLELTQEKTTEAELFSFISGGGRQGLAAVSRGRESSSPMPPFQFLLSEYDRWSLVLYLTQ